MLHRLHGVGGMIWLLLQPHQLNDLHIEKSITVREMVDVQLGMPTRARPQTLLLSNCLIEDIVNHVDLRLTRFGTHPPQPQQG